MFRNIDQLTLFKQIKNGGESVNLVFFPYLGGYANSFYEIAKKLDCNCNIWSAMPPGHGESTLPLVDDIDRLIDLYMTEVNYLLDCKTIFVGYSLGGVIAYHLLQRLKHDPLVGVTVPEKLLIMSSGAPINFKNTRISRLPDKVLLENLNKYEALPEEVFMNDYVAKYLLPIFRADYSILESAAKKKIEPLDVDVSLIWGMQDQVVKLNFVLQWEQYFTEPVKLTILPTSKHMFIHEEAEHAVNWINKRISV